MSRTYNHQPWKTTKYAQMDNPTNHQWHKDVKKFRRPRADSVHLHDENKTYRRRNRSLARKVTRDPNLESSILFDRTPRLDAYKLPSN